MSDSDLGASTFDLVVDDAHVGDRLDSFLARQLPALSRSSLRRTIDSGGVTVDGSRAKPSLRLRSGQRIHVEPPAPVVTGPQPEAIPLDLLYEDEALAAVNKPPGMVVHPSKGHGSGTLAAALRHHFERLSTVGGSTRPGIVHRLDRDTSGVIIVAKTDEAHAKLAEQFAARTTEKEYRAIVCGVPDRDRDVIRHAIGPHPREREKMAVRDDHPKSRDAETFYEVMERFDRFSLLRILPKTGRTHQIRVHLSSVGLPVLCDRLYGGRAGITREELTGKAERKSDAVDDSDPLLDRQALHAYRLRLVHPISGEPLELIAPLRDDLQAVLTVLRGTEL